MANGALIQLDNVQRVFGDYGAALVDLYRHNLAQEGKNASFALSNSVGFTITKGASRMAVNIRLLDYWQYLEYGRKPGKFPPIDKLREWIRVKPVIPRPMQNGRLPTPEQLAYLIGRKIARDGIAPTPILHDTVEALNRVYLPKIKSALVSDLKEAAAAVVIEYFK